MTAKAPLLCTRHEGKRASLDLYGMAWPLGRRPDRRLESFPASASRQCHFGTVRRRLDPYPYLHRLCLISLPYHRRLDFEIPTPVYVAY